MRQRRQAAQHRHAALGVERPRARGDHVVAVDVRASYILAQGLAVGGDEDAIPLVAGGVLGGSGAGAVTGAASGRAEVKAAKAAPRVVDSSSPGQKWARKTGYGKGEGYSVQEVAEAYERAKNKGKVSSKIPPGGVLDIERLAEQKKLAEELALKSKLAEGAQTATRLLGKIPLGSTLMGAGAGLEGAQAYEAYKHGDYPLAAIHGLGALGSAAYRTYLHLDCITFLSNIVHKN